MHPVSARSFLSTICPSIAQIGAAPSPPSLPIGWGVGELSSPPPPSPSPPVGGDVSSGGLLCGCSGDSSSAHEICYTSGACLTSTCYVATAVSCSSNAVCASSVGAGAVCSGYVAAGSPCPGGGGGGGSDWDEGEDEYIQRRKLAGCGGGGGGTTDEDQHEQRRTLQAVDGVCFRVCTVGGSSGSGALPPPSPPPPVAGSGTGTKSPPPPSPSPPVGGGELALPPEAPPPSPSPPVGTVTSPSPPSAEGAGEISSPPPAAPIANDVDGTCAAQEATILALQAQVTSLIQQLASVDPALIVSPPSPSPPPVLQDVNEGTCST